MKTISKKRKIYLLCLPILVLFALSGILLCKNTSVASSNSLTPERIYEIHKEYIESTYGPGTGFYITSFGESGVSYINHETREVDWDITDKDL